MVDTETAIKLAPKMYQASKQWILNSFSATPTTADTSEQQELRAGEQYKHQNQDTHSDTTPTTSTEYIVYNWLEALFAWFQVIVLWHDPVVSICALSGFLSSFLLLTYFAPRFYAAIMISLFIYNANKFWFRHVWPAIRVPPEQGREEEMILDVDRWTYLHPQLMTLAELNRHIKNLMKIFEEYLRNLLKLRQEKPVAFCSLVCLLLSCTAYIGNRISGMNLMFFGVATLSTFPGIYHQLLPDLFKHWVRQNLCCARILNYVNSESNQSSSINPNSSEQSIGQVASYEPTLSAIASKARSIETKALSLFEHFKRRRFNSQDSISETPSSSPSSPDHGSIENSNVPNFIKPQQSQANQDSGQEQQQQQQQQQQHIITGDTSELRSQREHKRGSDDVTSTDSASLVDSDDDQQDGTMLCRFSQDGNRNNEPSSLSLDQDHSQ